MCAQTVRTVNVQVCADCGHGEITLVRRLRTVRMQVCADCAHGESAGVRRLCAH